MQLRRARRNAGRRGRYGLLTGQDRCRRFLTGHTTKRNRETAGIFPAVFCGAQWMMADGDFYEKRGGIFGAGKPNVNDFFFIIKITVM